MFLCSGFLLGVSNLVGAIAVDNRDGDRGSIVSKDGESISLLLSNCLSTVAHLDLHKGE